MYAIIEADAVRHLRGNRWMVQNGYLPKYHAVLCDPPYSLPGGFMSKDWDHFDTPEHFQAWVTEWAELLLDYVYPGALLVAFGGTRTYHRLAAGIEDAGWEIADCLMWCYGSGFPKSAAIDKMLDKEAGAAREVVGPNPYNTRRPNPPKSELHRQAGWASNITAPATPLAARWSGYGTALKPAYEPAIIARAPRGKHTYAGLARAFGTGALNVDGGRIEHSGQTDPRTFGGAWKTDKAAKNVYEGGYVGEDQTVSPLGRFPANFGLVCACESDDHAADCPVAVLGEQSGERPGASSNSHKSRNESTRNDVAFHDYGTTPLIDGYGDTGTAARFFYQAKAAAWEREAGLHDRTRQIVNDGRNTPIDNPFQRGDTLRLNVHPTVKPIRLAEYLARLILPPELDEPRRLLVPFAGSGSEMIGALLAGWDVVTGIEREAEYVELARARVGWWAQFATYDAARAAYEKGRKAKPVVIADDKPAQLALFEEAAS